jgi:ribosomal protein S12 methylthiotransferase accessory factor
MIDRWYDSRFTGLFSELGAVPLRPHDPAVPLWSGEFPSWTSMGQSRTAGGAGWDDAAAEAACVGEAIERMDPAPLSCDEFIEANWQTWPLDEPAVHPGRWVLFHPEQYAEPNFPFVPLSRETDCRWVCFRNVGTGSPMWVPEDLAFLEPRKSTPHRYCPGVSTGLSCGRQGQPVLLRGLQEVIERDAILGAWWDRYAVEEFPAKLVLELLDETLARRLIRPNLRFRFYRVHSPFSSHVTMVGLEGEDQEGYCFSIGSACRETRETSWRKSILEAVQGRHYVRALKSLLGSRPRAELLADFPGHAVYYSLHPGELPKTILHRARTVPITDSPGAESFADLVARLGPERPVLFRNVTPPAIASVVGNWYLLRVLVPGLQPLHGSDDFPHLGGPMWAPRGLAAWADVPPHPFP